MTHVNESAANELFLYASNERTLYDMYIKPVLENFRRKVKKGTFNAVL